MKLKVKIDEGAFAPQYAHPGQDAGMDIRSPKNTVIPPRGSVFINSGVHVEIPHGFFGALKSKSGLNVKSCMVGEGVIDEGYTGSIGVKLYNHSDEWRTIERGQKIIQLVILPVEHCEIEIVDEIAGGERGDNGFGSTGA